MNLSSSQSEREGEAPAALLTEGATRAPYKEDRFLEFKTRFFPKREKK